MKTNLKNNNWWVLLAVLAWMLYTLGTYLYHHPITAEAITYVHYPMVLLAALGMALLGYWAMSGFNLVFQWRNNIQFYPITAWVAFLALLALLYYKILANSVPEGMPLTLMTQNFMVLSLKYLSLLLLLTMSAGSWGYWFLRLTKGKKDKFSFWVYVAFGFSLMCTLAFLQAAIAPLESVFLWGLIIAPLPASLRFIGHSLHEFFWKKQELKDVPLWSVPLVSLLGMFIALSWISSIKLYPTGYDGLTYYGNLARILGENGELVSGFQPYHWSLLMSWGWHLMDDPALGFLIGYLPGWLCLGVLYKVSRRYLSLGNSLIVLLLWMSLPVSTYHYGQTEKVDLALHFILLAGLLFYIQAGKIKPSEEKKVKGWSFLGLSFDCKALFWLLLGWLMGFALGIKLTAFFFIFAWSCLLFYRLGGYGLLRWGFLVLVGAFFGFGLERAAGADYGSYVIRISGLILLAAGIYELHQRYGLWSGLLKKSYAHLLALVIGCVLSFSIWPIKNAINSDTLQVQRLLTGPKEQPAIAIDKAERPEIDLPAQGKLAGLVFLGTSRREELGKFLGFDEGFYKYFTVLFKMSTNPGLESRAFVNIGFYLLFALPLLLIFLRGSLRQHVWVATGLILFFLSIGNYLTWKQPIMGEFISNNRLLSAQPEGFQGILAVFPQKINQIFYFIGSYLDQIPLLGSRSWRILNVFLAIALLLLIRKMTSGFVTTLKKKERQLIILVTTYLFMWYITGSGIPWYGFTGLALLFIILLIFFKISPKPVRTANSIALGLSFIILFLYRFSGGPISNKPASSPEVVLNSPLLYSSGAYDNANDILKNTNSIYYRASQLLNKDRDSKIYIAGTLFNYFIDDNHQRVHQDNQLGEFLSIRRAQEGKPDYFLELLIENGFDYIVYNPSDINYDRTPEQSFRKKFDEFVRLLNQSNLVELVMTDNKVRNKRGEVIYGIKGPAEDYGQLAVFKLKRD